MTVLTPRYYEINMRISPSAERTTSMPKDEVLRYLVEQYPNRPTVRKIAAALKIAAPTVTRDLMSLEKEGSVYGTAPTKTKQRRYVPTVDVLAQRGRVKLLPQSNSTDTIIIDDWAVYTSEVLSRLKDNLDSRRHPGEQRTLLDELGIALEELPPPSAIPWKDSTRKTISQVVDFIDSLLFSPKFFDYERRCFTWMSSLWDKGDSQTRQLLRSRLSSKVGVLLGDYRFERDRTPWILHQELNDFELEPMMALVKSALNEWKDDRFREMHRFIALSNMKVEDLNKVKDYLSSQMREAEDVHDFVRDKKAAMMMELTRKSFGPRP